MSALGDETEKTQTPVEWLHDDARDGMKDFFLAKIWAHDEKSKTLTLRDKYKHWRMFKRLADTWKAGKLLVPKDGFDYEKYFRQLFKMHEGEIKEVGLGAWIAFLTRPPTDLSFWHSQYNMGKSQEKRMQFYGCRGSQQYNKKRIFDWRAAGHLTDVQMLAIGSTTICRLTQDDLEAHARRHAVVISFPRLLCLVLDLGGVSIHTVEAWWREARSMCAPKLRMVLKSPPKQGTAADSKGKPEGKGQRQHGLKGKAKSKFCKW